MSGLARHTSSTFVSPFGSLRIASTPSPSPCSPVAPLLPPHSRSGAAIASLFGRLSPLSLASSGHRGAPPRPGGARFGLACARLYSVPAQSTCAVNAQTPFVIPPNRANPGDPTSPNQGTRGTPRRAAHSWPPSVPDAAVPRRSRLLLPGLDEPACRAPVRDPPRVRRVCLQDPDKRPLPLGRSPLLPPGHADEELACCSQVVPRLADDGRCT